ncbi:hypothetical protein B0H34DRAFT_194153 [Crassisporium funariophilum]|nr:hypothetical protein B0H34DRAFT_194153 [Crassisporium funariophilum]
MDLRNLQRSQVPRLPELEQALECPSLPRRQYIPLPQQESALRGGIHVPEYHDLPRLQRIPLPQHSHQGSGLRRGMHGFRARVSGLVSRLRMPPNALGLYTSPAEPLPVLVTDTSMSWGSRAASSSTSSHDPGRAPRLGPRDFGLNFVSSVIITTPSSSRWTDVESPNASTASSTNFPYSDKTAIKPKDEFMPNANAGQSDGPSTSVALATSPDSKYNLDPYIFPSFSDVEDLNDSARSQLKAIKVTSAMSVSECLTLLGRCPNLESATFSIASIGEALTKDVNPRRLITLSISSSINVGTLLDRLRIPTLTDLELIRELNGLDHFQGLQSFLVRSSCNVTRLELIGPDFPMTLLTKFIFDSSERLERLVLSNSRNDRGTIQSIVKTPRSVVTIWTTKALQHVPYDVERSMKQITTV